MPKKKFGFKNLECLPGVVIAKQESPSIDRDRVEEEIRLVQKFGFDAFGNKHRDDYFSFYPDDDQCRLRVELD